jgi:hypothetical protein
MKLERNVKAKERRAILKLVRNRECVGKRSVIRVRGHNINNEKLLRWNKEDDYSYISEYGGPQSRKFIFMAFCCDSHIDDCSVTKWNKYLHIFPPGVSDTDVLYSFRISTTRR